MSTYSNPFAPLPPKDHPDYHARWKAYNDWKNTLDTAYEDGYKEGFKEGFKESYEKSYREGYEKGYKEGYREGYKKGRQEVVVQIARSMLAYGIDAETVARITRLDLEQVKELGGE